MGSTETDSRKSLGEATHGGAGVAARRYAAQSRCESFGASGAGGVCTPIQIPAPSRATSSAIRRAPEVPSGTRDGATGCQRAISSLYGHNSLTRENTLPAAPALMNLYRYPDGSVSGVASMRHGRGIRRESGDVRPGRYGSQSADERAAANRLRSGRRAGQDLRRKVRNADLRRLLTFTNGAEGEGWTSLHQAVRDVVEWYLLLGGRELLEGSPIVIVAERGKGDKRRIHVHAAIKHGYFIDYRAIITSWSDYLTSRGFISTASCHRFHAGDDNGKHSKGFSSARVCADYMASYLGKGFSEEERTLYEKRYRVMGIDAPTPRRLTGFPLLAVPDLLRDTFGSEVECTWYESPDGDYGGWFIEVSAPAG